MTLLERKGPADEVLHGRRILLPVLLGVILLWTVVPLGWMPLSSLKPSDELTAPHPTVVRADAGPLPHLFSGEQHLPVLRNCWSPRACPR